MRDHSRRWTGRFALLCAASLAAGCGDGQRSDEAGPILPPPAVNVEDGMMTDPGDEARPANVTPEGERRDDPLVPVGPPTQPETTGGNLQGAPEVVDHPQPPSE